MGNSNDETTDRSGDYPAPDLNLINMVQRARMQNDATVLPSQAASMYWIEAKCSPQIDAPQVTARAAQWVITTAAARADKLWEQVKAATETGNLGYKSKICTASRTSGKPDERVILVCTYNKSDTVDVDRVRVALQSMLLSEDQMYYGQL